MRKRANAVMGYPNLPPPPPPGGRAPGLPAAPPTAPALPPKMAAVHDALAAYGLR